MSVFLPKTEFNLYNNPKTQEAEILKFWSEINLEKERKIKKDGLKTFVLHDGPPYANGPIHMGHAENKFWKDSLNKLFWQMGFNTIYIPGWDSHGLPIETAVEKELKAQGIDKNSLARQDFLDHCYKFSDHWMQFQMQQFKNLGVFGDFENSYATFFEPESIGIMECAHKFVEHDMIEQRFKPVLWSIAEKTALAYAEVEYKDKTANSIYILFPTAQTNIPELTNCNFLIWTTTPWTLSANEAVAYNRDFTYVILESDGRRYCVAESLLTSIEFDKIDILKKFSGAELSKTTVWHPLEEFRNRARKMVHSDHVDNQKGTGFVHIAPAHGEDDFTLGIAEGLNIEDLLDENGYFKKHVPLISSKNVKEAEIIILETLKSQNVLFKMESIVHSYPHSWRSKAPLIFRLTKQWFMKIEEIKKKALAAIENETLGWVPKEGKNRLLSMVESRQDWCISRQRTWGVPIGIFFNQETGKILNAQDFLKKTRKKLSEIGVKNWWSLKVEDIDPKYKSEDWQRLDDIIEIWFESGATQYFVLQKKGLFPCDVYLEGSDQHRGWFQSSLLISAWMHGIAPWKNLITHGFCLDGNKQKMSKSVGNVIDPASWNADTLRLFFATTNLCYDISVNEHSIKNTQEMMFRFRNTIKFLLGMLAVEKKEKINFQSNNCYNISHEQLPKIEQWILHKLYALQKEYNNIQQTFQFSQFTIKMYEFCSQDLSSFYFDIRKDVLYCETQTNFKRQAVIMCLHLILQNLLVMFASIMPFFAEEAWQIYRKECNPDALQSIHLANFEFINKNYCNEDVAALFEELRALRKQITTQTETLREEKIVSTSQELHVKISQNIAKQFASHFDSIQLLEALKEILIVSAVSITKSSSENIAITKLEGIKCPRCRFIYSNLQEKLCLRCAEAVSENGFV